MVNQVFSSGKVHSLRERTEMAEQFLTELARGLPDHERVMVGYADEATPQKSGDGKFNHGGWYPKPWKAGKGIEANNNCYVCISSSIQTMNEKTGRMRYWRSDANFGHGLALMVDDIGTGKGSKGALTVDAVSAILPPTAIVETSPGNHQLWYFLAAPEPNKLLFKGLLTSFVDAVLRKGGDWTIKDVTRYGRMPVGYNNKRVASGGGLKYPDTNGKPFNVRLLTADYSKRYTVFEIAKAFGFSIHVKPPAEVSAEERAERIADAPLNELLLRAAVEATVAMGLGDGRKNGSGKYRILCPWRDEHGQGAGGDDAYFRGHISGAEHEYVFGCAHDSCRKAKRTWSVFIDSVVMPYIADQLRQINNKYS
jgi:hypothetical protein